MSIKTIDDTTMTTTITLMKDIFELQSPFQHGGRDMYWNVDMSIT